MFDQRILPLQRHLLRPLASRMARAGVGADAISVAGFAVGAAAAPLLAAGSFRSALLLILLNRVLDGLDGEVARIAGPTDRGAFLDICLDFLFYALVPLGFAFHQPEVNALAAAVLVVSFVGTGSSFLAFAAIAERRGMRSANFPKKGLYYLGGLAEGTETVAVFILMCLLPGSFAALAWAFAGICLASTLLRWRLGFETFSQIDRTQLHEAPGPDSGSAISLASRQTSMQPTQKESHRAFID